MPYLTFNKVYLGLLAIAVISVLILPKPISDKAKSRFSLLFMPISAPVRSAIGPLYSRFQPPAPLDVESPANAPRSYGEVVEENRLLRLQNANMAERLKKLEELNLEREAMGLLRELSRPMRVVGTDASLRRSLVLQGSTEGLQAGMAVLYAGELAGKLDRAGWGNGTQAQLVTDKNFVIKGRFGRQTGHGYERVGEFSFVVQGDGDSGMLAKNLTQAQVTSAGVSVGDWVVVDDEDYPGVLHGCPIGRVTAIRPSRSTLGFSEIEIRPRTNLLTLREVMVLVR